FKYFVTKTTPGYVLVDCNSGEAKLVRSEGMKYMKSAYFFHDLDRHLFFHDPFAMIGSAKFELDDEGKPYWIAPVYKVTWVDKTRDVKGIYIVDPVDGACTYYDKESAPEWVDNIYPVYVIYDQFAQSKRYENGLFNFSKKGIVEFTDDYAYVQFNDHVHIYTGVTSVGKDESNVGFAYVDLRDGSIDYVRRAGAEEYSARSSAEGAVQQYHYTAIFPSMVNVKGIPTYFMGLVDGANLIKSYAFVSYENYQNVATGTSVEEAYRNYLKLYNEDGSISGKDQAEKSFVVAEVRSIVQNGNTIILLLSEDNTIYWYDMSDGDLTASFIAQGDTVKVMADEDGRIASFIR
ncbi:MAG: CvpA family protein, partial [Erysipelotrichaceae bacterium]|nr:CvpA family protein [Erysipelotrichaceae bacterium]